MKSTWFHRTYPIERIFPHRVLVWKRGMEAVYEVNDEGHPALLYDGRGVFNMLAAFSVDIELEGEALERAIAEFDVEHDVREFIQLISFETEEERRDYLTANYPQDVLARWTLQKSKKTRRR